MIKTIRKGGLFLWKRHDHTAHGKIERVKIKKIKQKLHKALKPLDRYRLRTKILVGIGLLVVISYGLIFLIPKQVAFSYSGQTCVRQLTIAPSIIKQSGGDGFVAEEKDMFEVAGQPIMSFKTCFTATKAPEKGTTTVRMAPFGSFVASKQFRITVGDAPAATVADFVGKTLPVTRPVEVGLSEHDEVFTYKLHINKEVADCVHKDKALLCDIEPLELAQGEAYDATLIRYFDSEKINTVGGGKITTLRALTLVKSSVSEGQVVYDKPTSLQFEFDKPVDIAEAELKIKNGESLEAVQAAITTDGNNVVVTQKDALKRNASYAVVLKKVEAKDGSAIPVAQTINFTTSGGPKVIGVNIGSSGTNRSGSIVVSFDQEIANVASIAKLVSTPGLASQISKSGKNIVINYSGAGACNNFSIQVKKGLESDAAIVQDADWSFNSRTQCYSTRVIGSSVKGRSIIAYSFGSGAKTILYTGNIHGNELGTRSLMNSWINELDANAQNIPAGVRIVVVPSANPDGAAANSRYNANGVDLNRNYNTSDWQKDVQTVNGDPLPNGGGSSPGSEPETKALAAYTSELQPALTMSYHSAASYAIANTCGNSRALADTYAKMTGYRNMTGVSGAFSYQITGTYDDWICERLGRASVLIELTSSTSSEFSRNKAALWAMARS